jgi:hypothetical protein
VPPISGTTIALSVESKRVDLLENVTCCAFIIMLKRQSSNVQQ